MSDSVGVNIALGLVKTVTCVYDVITLPLYFLVQKPWETRKLSSEIRAKQIRENDPYAPWVRVQATPQHFMTECTTIDELFKRAIEVYGDRQCFGYREVFGEEDEKQPDGKIFRKLVLGDYRWFSYREIDERIDFISKGFLRNGIKPGHTVLIFAETRMEWMITAQAIFRLGGTIATLYATLGDDGIVHGIQETEVTHIVTNFDLVGKLVKLQSRIPNVKCIIYMEGYKKPAVEGLDPRIKVLSLSQVENLGKTAPADLRGERPRPNDIAVLMYTSGSTGIPKGVMLTHRNILTTAAAFLTLADALGERDIYMGYLPLAHVLELAAELFFISTGVSVGYATPLTLTDKSTGIKKGCRGDAILLKPTIMASVPLILDRIRKGINEQVEGRGKFFKNLFTFAMDYKKFWTKKGFKTPILNFLICRKIKSMLGGRVRLLACGGAPLSPETHEFIRTCLDLNLVQGYGLTETSASATIMDPADLSIGRVGAPLKGVSIKLVDWPEAGYHVTDKPRPRGEIVVGGGNISTGYYKNDNLTKELYFEEDGIRYFYTGDIGEAYPDGTFKIIDRKKDLVKLQFGEYISLGKVEAELKSCPYVDNICVYGDSYHTYLIGLVVPNSKALKTLATQLGKENFSQLELCRDPQIISAITKAISEHGIKSKLFKTEIPSKIKLCSEDWVPDSGLVTAALKLRRKNIQDFYQMDINRMYGCENGVKST